MAFVFKQENLLAATETTIHTVTTSTSGIFDINIVNTSTVSQAVVSLSVTVGTTTTYLEENLYISRGTPLVRLKEMFPSTSAIKVESDIVGVDVTLAGVEE